VTGVAAPDTRKIAGMDKPAMIPFNRASIAGGELAYVAEAARSGHMAGDGSFTKRCSQHLEKLIGAPKVLLTTSCTHALEMSAMLLDIGPDDEVIIPSFTFVSAANAFVLRGAKIVFADMRPDTLNIDERHVESLISPRTKAIVVMHYAGVGCAMEKLMPLAKSVNAAVIEDNAHGLYGKYNGKNLGTFGAIATQSFHETKNITCGEGGALVLNDAALFERAEIIREKGTNRARFFRGQVDKYTWVDMGSSYLPSEMLSAFLLAQLEAGDQIQRKRMHIWNRYASELKTWADTNGIALPTVPKGAEHPAHIFYLLLPSLQHRQDFIAHMRERGVQSVFHYQALHLSPMGERLGGKPGDCPVTEDLVDRLVRLPLYAELGPDQDRVLEAATSYRAK
jgi:dTDP-4-amino-4,6-dideoxygalactose transaminase